MAAELAPRGCVCLREVLPELAVTRTALQGYEAFQTRWNVDPATMQLEGTARWL